ncbi:Piezo-type mechanosensitive ion channel component [Trichinella spiralis]|uniref:Piezo-type mechanosensitive ion channel component n=1 Tax=Trichinella spiralis TaxID=6334 RepID=A0ABR3KIH9_TRISP
MTVFVRRKREPGRSGNPAGRRQAEDTSVQRNPPVDDGPSSPSDDCPNNPGLNTISVSLSPTGSTYCRE